MLGPAGTAHCNLADWNKFITELILTWNNKGHLIKDKEIAKKYFTSKQGSPYIFGGWGRNDDKLKTPMFTHNGSNTFNYATALFSPEKHTVILLATNSGQPSAEKSIKALSKSIVGLTLKQKAKN